MVSMKHTRNNSSNPFGNTTIKAGTRMVDRMTEAKKRSDTQQSQSVTHY